MTTIRNLSQEWWNDLLLRSKVDFIRQYVDGITPTTSLTPEEIENIFYNEVILKWWDKICVKKHTNFTTDDIKAVYLKEHTKEEQPANLYCVSSNALVYGKPCEKWCGSEYCLRNEQPKEEVDVWEAKYKALLDSHNELLNGIKEINEVSNGIGVLNQTWLREFCEELINKAKNIN